jgi:DNA-binding NarL/FixJ family response regulator
MTDRETAQAMHVSLNRVRYAVRDLITRMSAHSRSEAVFIAASHGLLAIEGRGDRNQLTLSHRDSART